MVKYAGNQEFIQRGPTTAEAALTFGQALQSGIGAYQQAQKEAQNIKTLQDPNASRLQKALALKDNPKLAAEFLKEERMSQLGQHLRGLQESSRTPGIAPLEVEPSTQIAGEQLGQPRESLFEQIPESALQETMTLYPEIAPAIKEELSGRREREKLLFKQNEAFRKQEKEREEKVFEIFKDAKETSEKSDTQLFAANEIQSAIDRGEVDPFSSGNFAEFLKESGHERLSKAFETPGSAAFQTGIKELVGTGLKDMFGAKPAIVEFEAFKGQLPQVGRNKIANTMALQVTTYPTRKKLAVSNFKLNYIQENPEATPFEIESASHVFEKNFKVQSQKEWEINKKRLLKGEKGVFAQKSNIPSGFRIVEKDGERYQIPQADVEAAILSGGKLIQ